MKFCMNCGHRLEDQAMFCPQCGTKAEVKETPTVTEVSNDNRVMNSSPVVNLGTENSDFDGNLNWKDLLTVGNIERFAPVATLLPAAMAVVVGVLGVVLGNTIGIIPVIGVLYKLLMFVLKAVFVITTGAATGGLAYVTVTQKDASNMNAWMVTGASFLAFLACVGIAFRWGAITWILGLIAFAFGLEFLARIVIAGNSIDSAMNPAAAIETYKKYYEDYKAKNPAEAEKGATFNDSNHIQSTFEGTGLQLFGYTLLTSLVCVITCGLAAPWMICKVTKWRLSHTLINGKRLTFTGNGASLFGHWILWEILTVVTCGIYGFFVHVALRKWELNHTYIDGEPIVANGNESYFDGNSFEYLGYGLLSTLLLIMTLGLATPWVMAMIEKWDTKHQVINNRRLVFSGSGLGFLGEYIIIAILTVITCGIYSSWGSVRMTRYIVKHTDFVD